MSDDLDERLKRALEFFDKANYPYDFTVADALIDTRARLAALEAARIAKATPHPQGAVEDLATMLSETKSDPPIEGLELFAVMRERDYLREMVLGLQAERDRRALGGVEVTGEMMTAALDAYATFLGDHHGSLGAALTAAFALIPKGPESAATGAEPVAWAFVDKDMAFHLHGGSALERLALETRPVGVALYASPPPPVAAPGVWRPIESAPVNQPVLVWDGFEVDYATLATPAPIGEWWDCVRDEDDPERPDEAGYAAYLADDPEGWVSYDPKTGDETYMTPLAWMPFPPPPTLPVASERDPAPDNVNSGTGAGS